MRRLETREAADKGAAGEAAGVLRAWLLLPAVAPLASREEEVEDPSESLLAGWEVVALVAVARALAEEERCTWWCRPKGCKR